MTRPPDPQPVIPYATGAEPNRHATIALVWGLLGVAPVVLPGVLAIRYGRAGIRRSLATGSGGGKARAGVTLGILALAWSALVLASLPPAFIRARQQSDAVHCAANLRAIGVACMMYASANQGWLPPNLSTLSSSMGIPLAPSCPAAARSSTPAPPYVLTMSSVRLSSIKSPTSTPLAYEPLTNHGRRGINVLFADGHVEWVNPARAAAIIATATTTAPTTAPSAP